MIHVDDNFYLLRFFSVARNTARPGPDLAVRGPIPSSVWAMPGDFCTDYLFSKNECSRVDRHFL